MAPIALFRPFKEELFFDKGVFHLVILLTGITRLNPLSYNCRCPAVQGSDKLLFLCMPLAKGDLRLAVRNR